jgi:Fe-Mn family superoxide dismutase
MFVLPDLPYAYDALQPVLSEKAMRLHHDKHHKIYVETTNTLVQKAGTAPATLEAVIADSANASERKLFNNAAQAWNHAFYWQAMSPERSQPTSALTTAIDKAFGGMDGLKRAFVTGGADQFGSGWVWLVSDGEGGLRVLATHDADDFVAKDKVTPLLVCDVWEHAYYLDHLNDRKAFLERWFDALPNWRFAAEQLAAATGEGSPWRYPQAVAAAKDQAA